jgi:D-alanyl-D-alanine carboxypeptidase
MKKLLLLLFLFIAVVHTYAQQKGKYYKVDTAITHFMKTAKVPGVAVAILKNGKVMYVNAYGVSNLELNTPVKRTTVFELASLTKQFTSALIITMAHEGKLSLDDKLVKYIDKAPAAWEPITIRELLGHMAGLQLAFEPKMDGSYLLNYSKELMLKGAMETPMLTAPGTKWKYSDQGYFLAGYALEKATGRNFDTLMIDRIFKPIGMKHTLFLNQDNIIPNRAQGYIVDKNGEYKHNRRSWQFELTPHFGVMSTINDMILYEQSLVKGDVITHDVLNEATRPYRIFSDNNDGQYAYGMGWQLYTKGDRRVAEHAGYTGTVFVRDLKTGISVILLTNRDAAFGPSPILLAHHISAIIDPTFPDINLH